MLRTNFNSHWTYSKDHSSMISASTDEVIAVTLPHDAMISESRSEDNPSGNAGGFFPGGNYVYRKTYFVPNDHKGKKQYLEFEGVYRKARVYVNGAFAGSCANGYRNFVVDISPYLNFGADNLIEVRSTNGDVPNSRWYTGSGIYRPVNLLIGGDIHIEPYGLKIRTPDVAEDVSLVETELHYSNFCKKTKKVYFVTTITDDTGNIAAAEKTPVTLYPGDSPVVYQRIYVRDAKLWSVETPNLYTCTVKIMDADGCINAEECEKKNVIMDETVSSFGIRKLQMDPVYGLRINGEAVKLRGACIHHDNGIIGAATFAVAEERRVRIMKEAGFNAIRVAHNNSSVQLLEACDRIGMFVMEESFDMWNNAKSQYDYSLSFDVEWQKDIEAIVSKDYNHPCVIMYSIGNEIQEVGTPYGAKTNRELANKFRELDGTRFVTNAVNGLFTVMEDLPMVMTELGLITTEQLEAMAPHPSEGEQGKPEGDVNDIMSLLDDQLEKVSVHHLVSERLEEAFAALDLSGYNYMTGRYELDTEHYPNRIMFGSETCPPEIDGNWKHIKSNPRVLGDFTWTGWDYLGEAGVGVTDYNTTTDFFKPFPVYLAYCGDIDIIGDRRPASYYREIVWGLRKAPYIAVEYPAHYSDKAFTTPWSFVDSISSWTWNGFENKPIMVWVYSDGDEVELILNGKSLGRKPSGEANRFKASFDMTYVPGTLEAVSYVGGKESGRYSLTTAGSTKELSVSCDKECIASGGEELAYISIALTDGAGNLNTSESAKVRVTVEGAGCLQGFGSADPKSTENFFDSERTTFNGKLLAAVRSADERGEIKVTVSAEGLDKKTVCIKVV